MCSLYSVHRAVTAAEGGRTGVRDGAQGHYYISGGMLIEVYLPGDGKYAIALHCSSGSFMLGWQKRTVFTY